jgi:hypothetical protein
MPGFIGKDPVYKIQHVSLQGGSNRHNAWVGSEIVKSVQAVSHQEYSFKVRVMKERTLPTQTDSFISMHFHGVHKKTTYTGQTICLYTYFKGTDLIENLYDLYATGGHHRMAL